MAPPSGYTAAECDLTARLVTKHLVLRSEEDIEEEHRRRVEERNQWRAKLRPVSTCTDLLSRYMTKTKEGRKISYLSSNSLAGNCNTQEKSLHIRGARSTIARI